MAKFTKMLSAAWLLTMMAGLTGCDDNEKKPATAVAVPTVALTVGGTVTGLSGNGLILQLNGANELAVNANGKFNFPKPLTKGSTYAVTVKAAPAAPIKQTCTISQGSGSIASAAINNVAVACVTNSYAVGGTVSGLSGKGLVLQLNGKNDQEIASNGNFIFTGARLPDGSDYSVAIKSMPAKQKCEIKSVNAAFDRETLNIAAVTCTKKGRR
ncbi:MAG: hypothetical protein HY016_06610 [Nitrosomonadales bacterium]|nr:hypothetical protein [Nitrosomonadales bacterium]